MSFVRSEPAPSAMPPATVPPEGARLADPPPPVGPPIGPPAGPPVVPPAALDAQALALELKRSLRGEVRFDAGSRALYATDGSNYRQVPIGVILPREIEDVLAALSICRRFGVPVLARGCGTSLAGQCCNVAVVMDFSKYLNRVLELDSGRRLARVEPGVILDELRGAAEKYGLTFAPDPATHNHCTLGGMLGNNSCGVHSMMGGRTSDNVHALRIVTYDGLQLDVGATAEEELGAIIAAGGRRGEIYGRLRALRDRYAGLIRARYPKIPRRVSGYNLDELLPENGFHVARALVGTESTCVTLLEATLQLVPSPPQRALVVLGYEDIYSAGDHIPQILKHQPIGLEGLDELLIDFMKHKHLHPKDAELLPEGKGWLLVEVGGDTEEEARDKAERLARSVRGIFRSPSIKVYADKERQKKIWEIRESGLGATAFVPGQPDAWEGWEDSAVPPERVGDYLRELRKLLDAHGYKAALYGHFGQGCIHTRIPFDLRSKEGIRNWMSFLDQAADLVVRMGGSLSGEHGDGQARGALLSRMFGPELVQAFREFKSIWDPQGKMNPHKVVDAWRPDENLRFGPDAPAWEPKTHFRFPDDQGKFSRAALRCVGVGTCRRTEGGTMCPSFMVTREEEHTTRGRAHLLFEMMQADPIDGGWRDEHVKESLDLCLACKGCKGDCPVNVDMATYKAEFLSHYYEGRLRPRAAYAMGLIHVWARLASRVPWLANLVSQAPVLSRLAKAAGGIAPERDLPRFARQPFRSWFKRRPPRPPTGRKVVLWTDTFNSYFHPEILQAAVTVLETAGYEVVLPPDGACCGRPLFDWGLLARARRLLQDQLRGLSPALLADLPIVVLEPSCAATFRDELRSFFPDDPLARKLAESTRLLSEFLEREAKDFVLPHLSRSALVQGHCHHRAIMKLHDEEQVLKRLGLDAHVLDSGCCGMAGAFGFEAEHYDLSMKIGERVLLPAVRQAGDSTLVVADGFSCREQIAQGTERHALHLAEVIELALKQGPSVPPQHLPERGAPRVQEALRHQRGRPAAARGLLAE
ncbi:MAG: FAD-linked oxidase C-terminal domain-containing protein [Polyangia bacterium]